MKKPPFLILLYLKDGFYTLFDCGENHQKTKKLNRRLFVIAGSCSSKLTKNLTAEKSKNTHFGLYLIIFWHFVRIFLLNF